MKRRKIRVMLVGSCIFKNQIDAKLSRMFMSPFAASKQSVTNAANGYFEANR